MLLSVEKFTLGRNFQCTGVRQCDGTPERNQMVSTLTKIWFSVWISSVNEIICEKNMHLTHIFKCVKDSLVTYLPRPCLILSRNYLCASHKSLIFLYISDNIATIIERKKNTHYILVCSLSTQFCTDQILQSELKENLK